MKSGRVNSPESLATASAAYRAFGNSWAKIDRVARRDARTGVYVIPLREAPAQEEPDTKQR